MNHFFAHSFNKGGSVFNGAGVRKIFLQQLPVILNYCLIHNLNLRTERPHSTLKTPHSTLTTKLYITALVENLVERFDECPALIKRIVKIKRNAIDHAVIAVRFRAGPTAPELRVEI